MRIAVVGGGPSGLYFALLASARFPRAAIEVHEQNPRGATYGFGIVLADRGLSRLEQAHPETCAAILASSYAARHQVITHRGDAVFVERKGYGGAIARLRLLEILDEACVRAGVDLRYGGRVADLGAFDGYDLVVGADGVNSVVRDAREAAFGTTRWWLTNRMAWYGTTQHFPYPVLNFKTVEGGHFWCAAYPYTERMSTFVAECDADAWTRAGLDRMDDEQRRRFAEGVFARELDGHPLISNASSWRVLPVIRNRHWFAGRHVLIGDALHSAHPTIGSGTRIAMEDAIDLAECLKAHENDFDAGLAAFERTRAPSKQKLVDAAEKSFTWYEGVAQKMDALEPAAFVFDFMTRTGRIDEARLLQEFPRFMGRYQREWAAFKKARVVDSPLPRAGEGRG
ncbi:MAG TPA: FAD-dependent monooxygenase [Nevskiaceae bacterium]|nr:FAD-dependent monooxygenase [Nevskiaceae bacterium]